MSHIEFALFALPFLLIFSFLFLKITKSTRCQHLFIFHNVLINSVKIRVKTCQVCGMSKEFPKLRLIKGGKAS